DSAQQQHSDHAAVLDCRDVHVVLLPCEFLRGEVETERCPQHFTPKLRHFVVKRATVRDYLYGDRAYGLHDDWPPRPGLRRSARGDIFAARSPAGIPSAASTAAAAGAATRRRNRWRGREWRGRRRTAGVT